MASTNDSGLGHGTKGSPQTTAEEQTYPLQAEKNENGIASGKRPLYAPTPKHEKGGKGSRNPIKSQEEGQRLLDTGYRDGKQIYNITDDGIFVKFQPDNTPNNGYHSYAVSKPRDIPARVLRKMLKDSKISKALYNKIRKGQV